MEKRLCYVGLCVLVFNLKPRTFAPYFLFEERIKFVAHGASCFPCIQPLDKLPRTANNSAVGLTVGSMDVRWTFVDGLVLVIFLFLRFHIICRF
ncbi:hypothetical protein BX070DRAFT_55097 [Coemansia spiralis]|nr:hypothetical protein BX070DRAFT_55097 [Coemansia spiralis]